MLQILLGATWVHFPNGPVFTSSGGGRTYPVFLAAASVVHALAVRLPRLHLATFTA